MQPKTILHICLAAFLLWAAAACSTATPSASTPTATTAVETPTDTVAPATDTPQPTEAATAAVPTEAGTPGTAVASGTPGAAASTAPAASSGAAQPPADRYQYVSQNLPDKYQVRPGVPVTITWTVKNVGTTAWSANYMLNYFAGVKGTENTVLLGKSVAPGATATVSVTFTTPSVEGNYNTWWKLANAQYQNFGDVDFTFTVTTAPGKATPTP